MRPTDHQIQTIHDTAEQMFGADARVYLFGSRVDDSRRGGDIDLLVEVEHAVENRASAAARFAARLQIKLGDRRIDVLVVDPQTERQPIHSVARETGCGFWTVKRARNLSMRYNSTLGVGAGATKRDLTP